MKRTHRIAAILIAAASVCTSVCGCDGGGGGGLSVTVSPADAATDVALDAAITANTALNPDTVTTSSVMDVGTATYSAAP